jgi:hypothetical protein
LDSPEKSANRLIEPLGDSTSPKKSARLANIVKRKRSTMLKKKKSGFAIPSLGINIEGGEGADDSPKKTAKDDGELKPVEEE